jgi:hypothetical protein
MSNVFHKYAARTYFFNTSSSVYLGFARERVKRRFVIADISTSNITLCREHHVARELRFERMWSRFFRNFKSSLSQTWPRCLASAIGRFVDTQSVSQVERHSSKRRVFSGSLSTLRRWRVSFKCCHPVNLIGPHHFRLDKKTNLTAI